MFFLVVLFVVAGLYLVLQNSQRSGNDNKIALQEPAGTPEVHGLLDEWDMKNGVASAIIGVQGNRFQKFVFHFGDASRYLKTGENGEVEPGRRVLQQGSPDEISDGKVVEVFLKKPIDTTQGYVVDTIVYYPKK